MRIFLTLSLLVLAAASGSANSISLPGGTLAVPGISTTGTSFVYSGTLTQSDTLSLVESNFPCLQAGSAYCTNGAGVVTVAGTTGVGGTSTFSGTFNGTASTWNFGSLLLEISGEGAVQLFPANAADGLGSSSPPGSLTLSSTSLASLGLPSFSVANPTLTFIVADTIYSDNSGQFTLTQTAVPEPSTSFLMALTLLGLAAVARRLAR